MNRQGVTDSLLRLLFTGELGLQCLTALVLTGLTGTIMYGLWRLICQWQRKKNAVKLQFYLFRLTVLGFCVPLLYLLYSAHSLGMNPGARSGPFLLGTRMMCFWANVLLLFWMCGAGAQLKEKWQERRQFLRAIAFARVCGEEYTATLQTLCRKLHIRKKIRLCDCTAVLSPAINGICCPVIYLDGQTYSVSEMETILTHELIHFLHGDLVQRWLLQLLSVVYWFHPLFSAGTLYEVNRQISEAYCDSAVCEQMEQTSYIRTLLTIVLRSTAPEKDPVDTGCALAESVKDVCSRIGQMEKNRSCKAVKGVLAVCCVLAFAAGSVTVAYGAGTAVSAGYEIMYWNSGDDWQEERTDNVATDMYEDVSVYAHSENVVWQLPPGSIVESNAFFHKKGRICVRLETDGQEDRLCVGVITPDGQRRYCVKNDGEQTFLADESGRYRIFVWNRGRSVIQSRLSFAGNIKGALTDPF